jgi:serine/threonine-protein kinase RsbW
VKQIALLQLHASLKDLKMIRSFVEEQLSKCGVDADIIYDLVYSVNEIATNILVHGYGLQQHKSGPIEVELRRDKHTIKIAIRDKAPVYNPNDAPVPDIRLPLEARKPGGLGVFLVKEYMDQILHRPLDGGGNEVILVKKVHL